MTIHDFIMLHDCYTFTKNTQFTQLHCFSYIQQKAMANLTIGLPYTHSPVSQ